MKYPFMTFPDETVITHSDIFVENDVEKIKVYFEKPIDGGFIDATCVLPEYNWLNHGFSEEEISNFQKLLEKGVHVIYRFAKQGGFGHAANF